MPYTHKRSYKKNFLAYIESVLPKTVNPNETVPVNTGHCLRPLPFPQGMTVEWLACASTKAADRLKSKSKYHVEKGNIKAKPIVYFQWLGFYNMRKISQINSQFPFVFLWSPEPLKVQDFRTFWKTKSNWDKIKKELKYNAGRSISHLLGSSPRASVKIRGRMEG